jgi:hypothetical protein
MSEYRGCPSFYCDWKVTNLGAKIKWNGSEKSYGMQEWLPILIEKFFAPNGHKLDGCMIAYGEDRTDIWKLRCNDNVVTAERVKVCETDVTW